MLVAEIREVTERVIGLVDVREEEVKRTKDNA